MSDYIAATTHVDTTAKQLVFDSEGYYVVGDDRWQDITFTANITYQGGIIGLAPRIYDTNMYMFLFLYNQSGGENQTEVTGFASLDAQVTYDTYNIQQTQVEALVVGKTYEFKVVVRGTNYRISMDNKTIFNIEYPGMSKGKVGIYGTAGNTCSSIEVKSNFAQGWTTNLESIKGATAGIRELANEDKYLYLENPTTTEVYAGQELTVNGGKTHTLSFNVLGGGTAKIIELNGAAPKTFNYVIPTTTEWKESIFTETLSADCTRVAIRFAVANGNISVNAVQLEEKAFKTGYIHNDSVTEAKIRENSIITYPSKENIKVTSGTLVTNFKPAISYTDTTGLKPVIFEYGDASKIRLSYESGKLIFQYGNGQLASTMTLEKDKWYNVVATWAASGIQLYIDGVKTELPGSFNLPDDSKLIYIGNTPDTTKNIFYGAIDETIILSTVIDEREVEAMLASVEPIADNASMIMRATFNHAIGNFNKSIIEATLTPDYGSPVIVEKADGTSMRKVSFFDFYTGEYRTYNEELVQYDSDYDYIEISYHDKEVDQENFLINVENADRITYGSPYRLEGKRLYLTLSEEEKKTLDGQNLYASYQLEDSYTVDFNIGVPDSFRVTLGKHDGQPVKVVYEGNGFTDEKLATMVEMNPMLNPNHEGFLYVTRNDEPVTSFRIKATPENLAANGADESLIVVEPLDANGNYISHCKLDVSCEQGTIIPTYDQESVKLRDRAGRFLYRYRAPILKLDNVKNLEVTDYISVIDKQTGLGVQVEITLSTLRERTHTITAGDTLESIASRYGSTVEDIAVASDKTVEQVRAYIFANVGKTVEIPINYSAQELSKSPAEIAQDKMIGHMIELIVEYGDMRITELPTGLGALLDFNGDGLINIQEVKWLKENRLTLALEEKYNKIVAWEQAN